MATTNLNLETYSEASGSAVTFSTFRSAVAGNTSNMTKIDNFAGETSASITALQASAITFVNASQVSTNYYTASVATVGSYATGMLINLKLNVTNTGATTLNISELGDKVLKKMNVEGTLADMASGDLKKNRIYLLRYDGTYFVLVSPSTADQVSIEGSALNFVSISASGVPQDSGVPILSGVTTGSFNKVDVDAYGRVTGGSAVGYQTTSSVSGSSVMSNTTGSVVKHNASGITTGSYTKIIVDTFGHVTAGSQVTGISGSRTFYSASALGGSGCILNTVSFTDGIITSWTQV